MSSSLRALPYTAVLLVLAAPPLAARAPAPACGDAVSACVIGPTAPTGFRQTGTIDLPTTGGTVVVVNGQRVPLRGVVGAAQTGYAALTASQPLRSVVQEREIQLLTCGTGQVIQPDRRPFLGTVDGVPVYADQDAVQDIMEELQEARSAGQTHDPKPILEARGNLRDTLEEIEALCVPLQPAARDFRPVMRVGMVRAVRGQEGMCCAG